MQPGAVLLDEGLQASPLAGKGGVQKKQRWSVLRQAQLRLSLLEPARNARFKGKADRL